MCLFQNDDFCVLRLWIFYHQCLPFHLILPRKKCMLGVFFCGILLHFQVGYLFLSLLNLPLISYFSLIAVSLHSCFFSPQLFFIVVKCTYYFSHCSVPSQWHLVNSQSCAPITTFFFLNLMFIYFWERECEGGAEREGDTESESGSRLWAVSTEPDAGLELLTARSWPEPKSDA